MYKGILNCGRIAVFLAGLFFSITGQAANPYFYESDEFIEWKKVTDQLYYARNHVLFKDRTYVDVWTKLDSSDTRALILYRFNILKKQIHFLDSILYDQNGNINVAVGEQIDYSPKNYPKNYTGDPIEEGSWQSGLMSILVDPSKRVLLVPNDIGKTPIPQDNEDKWFYLTSLCTNNWRYINCQATDNGCITLYYDFNKMEYSEDSLKLWIRCRDTVLTTINGETKSTDVVYRLMRLSIDLKNYKNSTILEGYNYNPSGDLIGTFGKVGFDQYLSTNSLYDILYVVNANRK